VFGRKVAEKLDNAAATLHQAGKKVGGKTGGRVGDAVANTVLAPIRNQITVTCTRCAKGKCKTH
jgi:hypothetical protein